MADLNSGSWSGRIISGPRLRTGEHGLKVVWFMLACHRFIKDATVETGWREHTDKFPVVAWGYLAERVNKASLGSGTYITITGRLQTYDYLRKLETSESTQFTIPATGFEIALDTFNVVPIGRVKETPAPTEETAASNDLPETNFAEEEFEENFPF